MAFSLNHALLQSANRLPDREALRFNEQSLSYSEMVARTGTIARILFENGLKRQERVAVFMNRSFDSLVSIYGTMQAGGVYVPFDSFAPPARLAAILRDCDIHYLITEDSKAPLVQQMLAEYDGIKLIIGLSDVDNLKTETITWQQIHTSGILSAPDVSVNEQDLCLIFYTSGTTGNPKGAAHAHRSMLSNVEWALEKFGFTPEDRFSNVTSHHFDLSWLEMYASISVGGTLVVVPEQTVRFPSDLAELAGREQISVWCSVPSVLMQLAQRGNLEAQKLEALRWILFAGERFPTKHLKHLMSLVRHPRYCNMYGTTETHIALHWDVPVLPDDYEELIPIGKGCSHVDVMAVNPQGEQVKAGESGELVIRGPSLMEGYWHLPERNAKALIRHRFSPELEALCYHTGDLVQQMPDGNFYIIGRGDRRVKVRGNLVDLDEVEQVLLTHSQVQEAAAFTVSTDDDTAWVEAAIIPKPHNNPTSSELRVHVSRTLPTYAVPEKVRVVADFPRTGSGKMSRKDLQIAAQQELSEQSYPQDGDLKDTIKRYILTEILDDSGQTIVEDDTELLESGLMDSIGVVRLVAFLEDNSGVKVPNDEFIAENFSSLSAISNLVERLRVLR